MDPLVVPAYREGAQATTDPGTPGFRCAVFVHACAAVQQIGSVESMQTHRLSLHIHKPIHKTYVHIDTQAILYVHIQIHMRTYACTHTHRHMYMHTHTHGHTHTHNRYLRIDMNRQLIHTYPHTNTQSMNQPINPSVNQPTNQSINQSTNQSINQSGKQTSILTCLHTYIQTYIHSPTCLHARFVHACMHTCMCACRHVHGHKQILPHVHMYDMYIYETTYTYADTLQMQLCVPMHKHQ